MRALGGWRDQWLTKHTSILSLPSMRNPYTSQVETPSYAELLKLEAQPGAPVIQNADGTFPFMMGYDRLT